MDGSTIRVHRETENGYDVLEADGPAVVSVVKGINEPRYPSFKGIMAAKSKPVTDYTLADLGVDPGEVGTAGATTEVVDFAPGPRGRRASRSRTLGTAAPPSSWPSSWPATSSSETGVTRCREFSFWSSMRMASPGR